MSVPSSTFWLVTVFFLISIIALYDTMHKLEDDIANYKSEMLKLVKACNEDNLSNAIKSKSYVDKCTESTITKVDDLIKLAAENNNCLEKLKETMSNKTVE